MEAENPPKNLGEVLEKSAERFPEKAALYFDEHRLTYESLNRYSERFAQGLLNLGVNNQKVAIFLQNSPEFIVAYFGINKAGSVAVPINTMFKQEEAEFILRDSGASAIVTSLTLLKNINPIKEKLGDLKYIILTDALVPGTINFDELIERSIIKDVRPSVSKDDIAAVLYTSGTTGHPKGAMLTNANLISNVLSCISAIEVSHNDNVVCFLPMFHSFAWTVCVLMPVTLGASITIVDSLRPFRKLIRNVIKKKVTIFVGIPSIYHILSQMQIPAVFTQRILKMIDPLRFCISGAAALPVDVQNKFQEKFKVPLLEGYGLTEASPVVSLNPLRGKQRPGSVGKALKNIEVKTDKTGELLVKGPNVMRGYLNNPQETAEAINDGWLYTGDIARIDEEGYIYIIDRKKDMVNVRGLNVYPREVENVLLSHPLIKEAAVVRSFDKNKGEVPRAFIVLKEGVQNLSAQEIVHFCRGHLADFKIPKNIEFVGTLPKNSLGKVLKRELERA